MKSITIQGQKRESVGKSSTKALRNAEKVPCVVYGEGEPQHFSALEKSFKNLVYTPNAYTVELKIDDSDTVMTVLQDIQFHPITDRILHADFYKLQDDKEVSIEVPVRLEGRSKGVLAGGSLRFTMRKAMVKAIPANLPDEILINIEKLAIGDKITIAEIENDKFSLEHPSNSVVVAVKTSRNAVEIDEEEGETPEGENAEKEEKAEA